MAEIHCYYEYSKKGSTTNLVVSVQDITTYQPPAADSFSFPKIKGSDLFDRVKVLIEETMKKGSTDFSVDTKVSRLWGFDGVITIHNPENIYKFYMRLMEYQNSLKKDA